MKTVFSIVVPVFQNEQNLSKTIQCLASLQPELSEFLIELILVDDGSLDRSYEIMVELLKDGNINYRVVKLTKNFGQSAAIQAGLNHSTGDCVGIISADLQEPYIKFIDMIAAWKNGSKFVIGERVARYEGHIHKFLSSIYWFFLKKYAFSDFPRMGYDFCLLDRRLVDEINLIKEKDTSIFALIYWLGYKPTKVPICRSSRNLGKSQWTFFKKISFTLTTLVGFTLLPLRLVAFFSLFSSILSVGYLCYLIALWARTSTLPPGWMSVIGFLILFGSLTLFSLAVMCEYLLKIMRDGSGRPLYIVEEVIDNE